MAKTTQKRKPRRKDKPLKLQIIKELSREEFGRPGQGRNTTFPDRKAKANKELCRKPVGSDE